MSDDIQKINEIFRSRDEAKKVDPEMPQKKKRDSVIPREMLKKKPVEAMDELLMYVQIGKNEHDDAADSLAQLVQTIGGSVDVEVQVMRRFF